MRVVSSATELNYLLEANAPDDQIMPGFDPLLWVIDPDNVALAIDLDLAMFTDRGDGTWLGHIWFNTRGSRALERAGAILSHMFGHYGAKVIRGEVPERRKDVLMFVRKLGFKRTGEAEHPKGRLVVVTLNTGTLAAS